MTDDRTSPAEAFDLLVRADPGPGDVRPDAVDVARVVRLARSADRPAPTGWWRPPGGSRRGRVAIGVAAVAAVAAGGAVAAVALPADPSTGRPSAGVEGSPPPPTAGRPTAVRSSVRPTVAPAAPVTDPVLFLHTAASVTAAAAFTAPRPDQFLYVRESGGYQAWLSMDGTHDGLIVPVVDGDTADRSPVPGCRNGVSGQQVVTRDGRVTTEPTPCTPDPAYRPDVPSDPAALQQWLVSQGGGPSTNSVAKQVLATLEFDYLTPATRGALYTVLAGYDGLSVVPVASEPDAVGVTWSYGGGAMTLVFGRADHAYRGYLSSDGGGVDGVTSVVVDAVGLTG